jgi:hypothetical protein
MWTARCSGARSFDDQHRPTALGQSQTSLELVVDTCVWACERQNLLEALRRVKGNKGSAGIDGMTVGQLSGYLKEHGLTIREQLLNGTYKPQPVRHVEIEKPVRPRTLAFFKQTMDT